MTPVFLAVAQDKRTGERRATAVLWLPSEATHLRQLYGRFSQYECVTYMCELGEALAILRGEAPLPPPVEGKDYEHSPHE